MIEIEYLWISINIGYLINGISPLLKARIRVTFFFFFAYPQFFTFRSLEAERAEHVRKANRRIIRHDSGEEIE